MSELPEGWARAPIEDLGDVRLGRQRSPSRATGPHMCSYMRAANVSWTGLRLDDVKEMDFTPEEQEVYRLIRGDIIVGEASGSRTEVGKSAVWRDEIPDACFQNTLIRVRPLAGISSEYVQHHLLDDARSGRLAEVSKGVGIHHLSAKGLREWEISLPPLNEQKRIVAKIDALTEKSREARQALDEVPQLLDKLRQSILAAAFRGDLTKKWREQNPDVEPASVLLQRIRKQRRKKWEEAELAKFKAKGKVPKDDKWKAKYKEPEPVDTEGLPELPKGWCWASVEEISSALTSGSRGWSTYYGKGTGTFILAGNVRPHGLDLAKRQLVDPPEHDAERLRTQVEDGDVLITIVGANTGDTCIVPEPLPEHYVCQSVALIRPLLAGYGTLMWRFLQAKPGGRSQLERFMYGQGRPHLSFDQLRSLPVPLIPQEEQQQVTQAATSGLALLAGFAEMRGDCEALLPHLDSSILAKAFRGELVPQDPQDEPASVLLERIRGEREKAGGGKKKRATRKKS